MTYSDLFYWKKRLISLHIVRGFVPTTSRFLFCATPYMWNFSWKHWFSTNCFSAREGGFDIMFLQFLKVFLRDNYGIFWKDVSTKKPTCIQCHPCHLPTMHSVIARRLTFDALDTYISVMRTDHLSLRLRCTGPIRVRPVLDVRLSRGLESCPSAKLRMHCYCHTRQWHAER